MNIIGHKYIYLTISGVLVLASWVAIGMWGLHLGIDFTGGSLLELEFRSQRPTAAEMRSDLTSLGLKNVSLQPIGEKGVFLRFQSIDEATHQKVLRVLTHSSSGGPRDVREKRFDSIGPTIGRELKVRAVEAIIFAIIAIVLYVSWAFRKVSKPVSSWKYGMATIVALVHDVSIPTGIFSILGYWRGVEVDTLFVTALLTILGFSVHDTIVVFDRIRENLKKLKTSEPYEATVNRSVNETLGRSLNTSLTVLLVLLAIFFWGGETTTYFALALLVGIVFGTYSSIFVASPLVVIWNSWTAKK